MKITLSKKIILTIGAGVIASSVFLSIMTLLFMNQISRDETNLRLNSISYLKSNSVNQYLQMHVLETKNTIRNKEINKILLSILDKNLKIDRNQLIVDVKEYFLHKDNLLDFSILDEEGVVVASVNEGEVGKIKKEKIYFLNAKDETFVQNFSYDILTKQIVTIISSPIKNKDGKTVGVLFEKINTNNINKIMTNRDGLGDTGETFFVNSFNFVTTDLLKEPKGRFAKMIYLPQINDCLKGNSSYYLLNDYRGDKVFGYARWIPEINSCLISKIDKKEIMTPIINLIPRIIAFLVIILLTTLIFGYLVGKSIIKPLKNLRAKAIKIKDGDLDVSINPETSDEVGDLAVVLNGMILRLKNVYKGLEDMVQKRTMELEKSERKLRDSLSKAEQLSSIVRDSNEPIFSQDLEGRILSWNTGAEEFFGYSSEEMIGNSIELIIPENKDEELEKIKKIINSGEKIDRYQTKRRKKDGSIVDVAISVSPIKDSEIKISGVSVVVLDITKEKQIDKVKTEFVSIASHQFRAPLSTMNWYTEMLLAGDVGVVNNDQKKYLEEILIANKRMVNLVDDLLNVSRLDMGKFVLDISRLDLIKMLDSVLKELEPQIERKKIIIEKNNIEGALEFEGDDKLMRMIFQNLLSNAVKYSLDNGLIIVNLQKINEGKNFGGKILKEDSLCFSVSDQGVGIPYLQQDKVFSKLFRADNIKKSEPDGTGLGLYVVKSVADQSGGNVWFVSKENQGATFYVSFPATGMKDKLDKDGK